MGNIYQQYYTKSNEILTYMINKLSLKPNSVLLEPCAGDGVFIDAVLEKETKVNIDAFELDPNEANKLVKKYNTCNNISIRNEDTLLFKDFINNNYQNKYDYIIANPPYGAWQNYEKREILKEVYRNLYIKETYSTFLYLCIRLLKNGGRLVFITPDTYLNLHRHTYLRKYIFQNTIVEEIALFPSKFFPGVNFGYSKLSIITLVKSDNVVSIYNNKITVLDNFKEPQELNNHKSIRKLSVSQKDILENDDYAFIISDNNQLNKLLKYSLLKISDIADCVTGIYTGNDKEYIKVSDHSIKNSKNYKIITSKEIYNNQYADLNGINKSNYYIPIIKGGNTKYLKDNIWFINLSVEAVDYYKSNRKSRFQNSQFYFKQGIAVPMVGSNCVSASLLNNRLFDQSIVGIFPKEEKYILYLLGFFNTSICLKLLRAINPSANNSANYIKKIPLIIPDDNILKHINYLVNSIILITKNNGNYDFIEDELENIFNRVYFETDNNKITIKNNKQKELFVM
jgi:tRNA1(Val) A37 N6-methylase TrmN6